MELCTCNRPGEGEGETCDTTRLDFVSRNKSVLNFESHVFSIDFVINVNNFGEKIVLWSCVGLPNCATAVRATCDATRADFVSMSRNVLNFENLIFSIE